VPNVDSNAYTLGFATVIVVGVALILSGMSVLLKERSVANKILDDKSSILASVDRSITKATADGIFDDKVQSLVVSFDGSSKKLPTKEVLDIDLRKEFKKDVSDRNAPVYVYKGDEGNKYIFPMRGNGLWDEIWGFMCVKEDFNTVSGISFDHAGETPGLGAEITKDWFKDNFKNEKLFNDKGEYVGIEVLKGKNNPANSELHKVDGMSGATITGDGVSEMIDKSLQGYLPFIKKSKNPKTSDLDKL